MELPWAVQLVTKDDSGVAFCIEHYKPFRLRALQSDPSAFGSTFARENAFTDDIWRERALKEDVKTFVAVSAGDGHQHILSSITLVGPVDTPSELAASLLRSMSPDSVVRWAVNGVFTAPEARRKGVGRATARTAMQYAVREASARGKDCLLTAIVYATNTAAKSYYESLGFVMYNEGQDHGRQTHELSLLLPRNRGL